MIIKRGYTLIEVILGTTLLILLTIGTTITLKRYIDRKEIEVSKESIVRVLTLYKDRSRVEEDIYELKIDLIKKEVEVYKEGQRVDEEKFLSEFTYVILESGDLLSEKKIKTTKRGGMTSFSIYILDRKDRAVYRVAVDGINISGAAYINVYRRKDKELTIKNIKGYRFNRNQWIKE